MDNSEQLPVSIAALLYARSTSSSGDNAFIRMSGHPWQSFQSVYSDAMSWSRRLQAQGVAQGDRVAVMVPTSVESVLLWVANGIIGSVEVPVHTELRGAMLSHVIADSECSVVVVSESLEAFVRSAISELPNRPTVLVCALGSGADRDSVGDLTPPAHADDWDTSAIIYTSGTTGPAKGVMIPWGQWRMGLYGIFPDIDTEDTFYVPLPLHHIAGRGMVYRAVAAGGRVALRERFSVSEFLADVRDSECTATILMGAMAEMIWQASSELDDVSNPLKKVLMTPLIKESDAFARHFDVKLRTNFGMTEVGATMVGGIERPLVDGESCGTARSGYILRVADEHDREVPHGTVGELLVRTEHPWMIMTGYWQDSEKTVAAWRNQWFHTGDAFRRDADGNYYFVDRFKDTIRRRGENVSSFHLELDLLQHPGVAECAIVGVPSAETDEEVHAFVVRSEDTDTSGPELVEFLHDRIARFMIPRYWTFVSKLPKTPTLRVRKAELRNAGLTADTWDRLA